MTEENKAIVRRLYQEIMNDKSVAAVDQYIAADVVEHNPSPGQGPVYRPGT
jgi:predicted SnoaL-like aldol condensation-catalyzing enzyme